MSSVTRSPDTQPQGLAAEPSPTAPHRRLGAAVLVAIALAVAVLLWFWPVPGHAQTPPNARGELRIGFQKSASLFVLQKAQGTLEKKLAPLGFGVKWVEFPAGPQLLEGLNVGAVDVGFVGEAPPIFAQAAGAQFVYFGFEPAAPQAEAILVTKDSPIKSVAELKGKKVALNKGSNVHYLLVKQLEKHGLKFTDIEPIYLAPADGRAAFESKRVDAWVIWDPFLAAAEVGLGGRVLADATGVVNNRAYYFSSLDYAAKNADALKVVVEEINKLDQWGSAHRDALASEFAPLWGIPKPMVDRSVARAQYGTGPITKAILQEQQVIADTFFNLKLIPKRINVLEAAVNAA